MAADERWYFTKEEINNSPSRKCGIDTEKELSCRQQGAKLIQDMGQRLHVTQLVINTAIVYMHRFYMFHSFAKFHRNSIAPAALFLAAKVEEQPRKLEHVIKVAHYVQFHHEHTNLDTQSESYMEKAQELVMNENILLQTLGFDVAIDHPHTYVVKCFQMVRTTTELAQTSYFMATNSLHMTTMCLQYRPAVVACVCIYIVCKWSNYEIQRFTEGKDWFCLVDPTVTVELLEHLTSEFLAVLDKYPSRLKKLMNSGSGTNSSNAIGDDRGTSSSSRHGNALSMGMRSGYLINSSSTSGQRIHDPKSGGSVKANQPPPTPTKTVLSHKEYSEKREKERKERERMEQKEKFAIPISSLSSSSGASSNSGSNSVPSSHSASSIPHSRSLPSTDVSRRPAPDARQVNAVHGAPTNRHSVPHHSLKETTVKRESISSVPRSGDMKFDKLDRDISEYVNNSIKLPSDKLFSSNIDHKHSNDWYHLSRNKDKKLESKDIKLEQKLLPKDTRGLDSREPKTEPTSGNGLSNPLLLDHKILPKSEPIVKAEKSENRSEVKSHHNIPLEDIKPTTNSFIFNNDDFSLRDFLNPSAMPPEDIFDTGSSDSKDFKEETGISKADMLSLETTHVKLLSPPSFTSAAPNSAKDNKSPAVSSKSSSNHISNSKSHHSSLHRSTPETKTGHKHVSPSPINASKLQVQSNIGKQSIETTTSICGPTSSQTQVSSSRKKEKKSPCSSVPLPPSTTASVNVNSSAITASPTTSKQPKVSMPNSDSAVWLSSLSKANEQPKHAVSTKTSASTTSQQILVSKEDNMVSAPHGTPIISSNPSQKHSHSNYSNAKLSSGIEPSTLSGRLSSQPENVDAATNKLSSFQIPVLMNSVSSLKKHKHEHGHHKHKKKKKHKHKESSKHRDKEKKVKKHKKHKEKDKEKQSSSKADPESLKITLRTKGVYLQDTTPGAPMLNSPPVSYSHSKEHHNTTKMNPPTGIKLTIPKSRLQVNTPSSSEQLTANLHDVGPQKVKLKLPRESYKDEKDSSRKRAREDQCLIDGLHPTKMARSGSGSSSSYQSQVPAQQQQSSWPSQRR